MQEIIDKAREYYESWWSYSPLNLFRDYTKTCVIWALNDLKNTINQPENATEIQLYSELEHSKIQKPSSEQDERENTRISRIMDMISAEKIFPTDTNSSATLHTIMSWLTPEQYQKVKNYILKLKTIRKLKTRDLEKFILEMNKKMPEVFEEKIEKQTVKSDDLGVKKDGSL